MGENLVIYSNALTKLFTMSQAKTTMNNMISSFHRKEKEFLTHLTQLKRNGIIA